MLWEVSGLVSTESWWDGVSGFSRRNDETVGDLADKWGSAQIED